MIGLVTAIVGLTGALVGVIVWFYNFRKTQPNSWQILQWRKDNLEDLVKRLLQPTDGSFRPELSAWKTKATDYTMGLNIEELRNGIGQKCCADIEAGLVMQVSLTELNTLIDEGQRISRESVVKGYIQREIDIIGSAVNAIKEAIWQEVSQGGVGVICIYGIAGVGKTTIAAHINNRALIDPTLFDSVIWVTVSDGADLWQVQEDIAGSLSIKLPAVSNIDIRASALHNTLTERNRFLLILDSMWQRYSPTQIGIPNLTEGRKLIVTSRLRSVRNLIAGSRFFEITPLSGDDAWTLFENEAGADVSSQFCGQILTRTRTSIEQELQGVPLAIRTLAETLRDIRTRNTEASIDVAWTEELDHMSRSATFLERRNRELFTSLLYSYKHLQAETQPCFLFCAKYPKTHPIETKELIEYWMWEGLLGDGSLGEMRSRGRERLNELKDANLLESVNEAGMTQNVKMPNLIRGMAVAVASGQQFFIESGNGHTEFTWASTWPKDVVRVSFMRNQLTSLALGSVECCFDKLSTLLLQGNPLKNHHHEFFKIMLNLRVLDLSQTELSSLPNSLSGLTNLRALLLRNCPRLKDLPPLSKLNQLHVLDVSGTQLQGWPEGMQNLTKMRRLDISGAELDNFPHNCLRSYMHLEELVVMGDINTTPCVWGSNSVRDWSGACIEWLLDLQRFAVLQLVFLNAEVFNTYVNLRPRPATRFKFCVGGSHSTDVESIFHKNSVTVIDDHHIKLPDGTQVLNLMNCAVNVTSLNMTGYLGDLTDIHVSDFGGLKFLFTLDMLRSLANLRKVCVRRCWSMEGIIQPAKEANSATFSHPSLAELVLFDLPMLASVYQGQVLHLKSLTRIEVWKCELLKLPMLLGVRGTHPIVIKGERTWWDALQRDNPDILGGDRVTFQEAPEPPELSSPPSAMSVGPTSNCSNHPQMLRQSAGDVGSGTAPGLRLNVQNAIGNFAPNIVKGVARTLSSLMDSVSALE